MLSTISLLTLSYITKFNPYIFLLLDLPLTFIVALPSEDTNRFTIFFILPLYVTGLLDISSKNMLLASIIAT